MGMNTTRIMLKTKTNNGLLILPDEQLMHNIVNKLEIYKIRIMINIIFYIYIYMYIDGSSS